MQEVSKDVYGKLIAVFLAPLLLALSFPKPDIEILAWVGLIPLFYLINRSSLKEVFFWCWVSGILFFLMTLYWLTGTMSNYGGIPAWISLLVLLLLALYLGLYFGIFGVLTGFITGKTALPLTLIAPPLWVTLEYIRAHLLTGFPWVSLGYSQYKFLPIVQIADITSFPGISFLIVGVNATLFEIASYLKGGLRRPPLLSTISLAVFPLLFFVSLVYGFTKLQEAYDRSGGGLNVAVLQGNIPQHLKWDRHFQQETLKIYERLTEEAGKGVVGPSTAAGPSLFEQGTRASLRVDLVIWPETAAPFFFQDRSVYRRELFDLAGRNGIHLLFGSPSYTTTEDDAIRLLNSAYLISPSGETISRYDKIHLVPFGEYVPLSKLLFFLEKMVVGIGDFIPGRDYTVFQTPKGDFGNVICFEVIFPDLVRNFVLEGAEFMTTITNDAWFGKSAAPYQHFAMVVFRAVENRVYFARAANTGISGFISPKGEVLGETPLFVESFLVQKIYPSGVRTFYTRYGDIFTYLCIALTGLVLIITFRKSTPSSS